MKKLVIGSAADQKVSFGNVFGAKPKTMVPGYNYASKTKFSAENRPKSTSKSGILLRRGVGCTSAAPGGDWTASGGDFGP